MTAGVDDASVTAQLGGLLRGGRRALSRAWPVVRFLAGIGLAALALYALGGHRDELSGFEAVLHNLRWWWLPVAVVAEAASYVAFAGVQFRLLATGGVEPPIRPLLAMTFAAQSINNSLPAGGVFATVYGFRWYRRFGADDTLAAWALVGVMVASVVSLALVAAGGLALAADQGADLGLIPAVVGVLLIAVSVGALFVYERPLEWVVGWALRTSRRLTGRPRGELAEQIARVVERVTVVRLSWRDVSAVVGWGLANWLLDCACFAFCFLVIGATIPWGGLLLAYGAGQLAANLPITPGGLGAVEGSITFALVAFGGDKTSSVDAVLVYRLISFWSELGVGWACAGWLALGVRREKWPRQVLDAPVDVRTPPAAAGVGPR
ncbi:MAG TPA: YbhN family protein [Acidimicrobiales bacterium]|nr:YbhN family protein [Acidimicrobiales bacterium]